MGFTHRSARWLSCSRARNSRPLRYRSSNSSTAHRGGAGCGSSAFCCRASPSDMDLFPIWLSLRVALLATLVTVAAGVPCAWLLARRRFPGRDLVSALLLSPLVLPPTVLGYYLLMLIGSRGAIGRVLGEWNIELAFTARAAVLAAAVGSF